MDQAVMEKQQQRVSQNALSQNVENNCRTEGLSI